MGWLISCVLNGILTANRLCLTVVEIALGVNVPKSPTADGLDERVGSMQQGLQL